MISVPFNWNRWSSESLFPLFLFPKSFKRNAVLVMAYDSLKNWRPCSLMFILPSLRVDFLSSQKLLAVILLQKKKSTMQVLAANISIRISIVKIVCKCFFSRDRKAGLRHQLPYFLFYMPRCLFNFGTFRCSIYKTVAFISKIKTEENEIMCQFKTIRYFLNHELWN